MVYPRPRTRRDQASFKIKSVLNRTEHEGESYGRIQSLVTFAYLFPVARHELVPWLQERIAEQKRIDAVTSGAERSLQDSALPPTTTPSTRDVQLLLPGDLKKGKAGPKQRFSDRGSIRPHDR
jgi:translation initiation factor 2-alpha kinase 4